MLLPVTVIFVPFAAVMVDPVHILRRLCLRSAMSLSILYKTENHYWEFNIADINRVSSCIWTNSCPYSFDDAHHNAVCMEYSQADVLPKFVLSYETECF